MEMHTILVTADPASQCLRSENRRLHKACRLFRRMAIVATVVVVFQTLLYLGVLTRMNSVHKTIEAASRNRVAAARQEAALYRSLLDCYVEREAQP